MYHNIKTIRYMGNKNKLLDFIIPEILNLTDNEDVVCDLMSGTCSISYALKEFRNIITNDIQFYSYIIAKALIENNSNVITSEKAINDLYVNFDNNKRNKIYSFFVDNYSDTYFSSEQCLEIDSIRFAIDQLKDENDKHLYLVALMNAMCVSQSTSGHFAQYLPSNHPRLYKIKNKSIWEEFLKKTNDLSNITFSKYKNTSFNLDYRDLIKREEFEKANLIYIDPPYTGEQYSRFYHILETVCKYDNPQLEYKALYRQDRFKSNLSLRKKAFDEFEFLLKQLSLKKKKIVLSYSTKGLLKEYEMEFLFRKYFKNIEIKRISYNHSTQGKGSVPIEELLFIAY